MSTIVHKFVFLFVFSQNEPSGNPAQPGFPTQPNPPNPAPPVFPRQVHPPGFPTQPPPGFHHGFPGSYSGVYAQRPPHPFTHSFYPRGVDPQTVFSTGSHQQLPPVTVFSATSRNVQTSSQLPPPVAQQESQTVLSTHSTHPISSTAATDNPKPSTSQQHSQQQHQQRDMFGSTDPSFGLYSSPLQLPFPDSPQQFNSPFTIPGPSPWYPGSPSYEQHMRELYSSQLNLLPRKLDTAYPPHQSPLAALESSISSTKKLSTADVFGDGDEESSEASPAKASDVTELTEAELLSAKVKNLTPEQKRDRKRLLSKIKAAKNVEAHKLQDKKDKNKKTSTSSSTAVTSPIVSTEDEVVISDVDLLLCESHEVPGHLMQRFEKLKEKELAMIIAERQKKKCQPKEKEEATTIAHELLEVIAKETGKKVLDKVTTRRSGKTDSKMDKETKSPKSKKMKPIKEAKRKASSKKSKAVLAEETQSEEEVLESKKIKKSASATDSEITSVGSATESATLTRSRRRGRGLKIQAQTEPEIQMDISQLSAPETTRRGSNRQAVKKSSNLTDEELLASNPQRLNDADKKKRKNLMHARNQREWIVKNKKECTGFTEALAKKEKQRRDDWKTKGVADDDDAAADRREKSAIR